jgi:hypothetical protein
LTRMLGSVRGASGNGRPYRDPGARAVLGAAASSESLQRRYGLPPRAPFGGCSWPTVGVGSAEPVRKGRRPVSAGKESDTSTRRAPRRRGSGTKERIDVSKWGRSGAQPRPGPYGKDSAYNREAGSRREGSRLAAEAVRAMTARTTQPRLSKGPLGERGRRLQERPGVVPLAAITRRGAVPVWLRASWSGPLAAAKAASQPANCRRHAGWSRSPSPCARWETRSLICARFQPDWGKPNVRLIGGREETGASRRSRAARGASRLPDHQQSPDPYSSVELWKPRTDCSFTCDHRDARRSRHTVGLLV